MKKEITIPTSKILGALTIAEGLCAAILVDETVKSSKCNKHIKAVGRNALSGAVMLPFMYAASEVASDPNYDIKINVNRKDRKGDKDKESEESKNVRDKDIKRFLKVIELWQSIVDQAKRTSDWFNEYSSLHFKIAPKYISKKDVHEFNKVMMKLDKRIGFSYVPIAEDDDNMMFVMNDIINSVERINDNFHKCQAYIDGSKLVIKREPIRISENTSNTEEVNNTDKELVEDINNHVNSHEDEDMGEGLDISDFVDTVIEIFDANSVSLNEPMLADLVTHHDDELIKTFVTDFRIGLISADNAFNYITARMNVLCPSEENTEDEDYTETEITAKEDRINISDELVKALSTHNITPDDIDTKIFSDIYEKFARGELSATDACNKIAELAIESKIAKDSVDDESIETSDDEDIEIPKGKFNSKKK